MEYNSAVASTNNPMPLIEQQWNSPMVVELVDHTDPLLPAFPLCSGSKTCERLLDPALVKAAGFFFLTQQSLDFGTDKRG